ncbi:hypothetical protein NM688_g6583 [Phlebia brevispora]|uniref:Uncharacterized protein n=1 Tax=Phlebia brevispora TaxID=194682 RepID=A0ACC1SEE0_9APHY|nr:hypothetical protein NM688_g6583 [Phlebia brevispora]
MKHNGVTVVNFEDGRSLWDVAELSDSKPATLARGACLSRPALAVLMSCLSIGCYRRPNPHHISQILQCLGDKSTTERPSGWSAVEHYMRKHDEGMIRNLEGDVDTFLVFAGLFCAVLTTFTALQSYSLLQADNTQTTVELLTQICAQLESPSSNTIPLNSTQPVAQILPFSAPASAICINVLWFLSLVLSLAAALFGIIAKQWFRHHIARDAVLALPQDNVLVRQMRFDAWMAWKVPIIVATIPALLEVTLVLSLSGIIVFKLLWILNHIAAGCPCSRRRVVPKPYITARCPAYIFV